MKKILYVIGFLGGLNLFSCNAIIGTGAVEPTSSGFSFKNNIMILPEGIPKIVGVATFTGDNKINIQATDRFSSGLIRFGFNVVERQHLDVVISELGLHQTRLISNESIQDVGKQLGLEGIFVGSISSESSAMWVDTYINVKLVDVQTGKILWFASTSDPRTFASSMDVKQSIGHTINEALKLLERDLKKYRNKP